MDREHPAKPVMFGQWPEEAKVEHMEVTFTREGLIRTAFGLAGYEPDREIDSRTRLRKDELASVVLALERERAERAENGR